MSYHQKETDSNANNVPGSVSAAVYCGLWCKKVKRCGLLWPSTAVLLKHVSTEVVGGIVLTLQLQQVAARR